jgi:hypothetical protein
MNLGDVSFRLLVDKGSDGAGAYFDQSGYLFPAMIRTSIGLVIFSGSFRR